VNGVPEELARLAELSVDSRNLDSLAAKTEHEAVLFGHAIETPGIVRWTIR
jgi:hypothetical protein